MSEVLSPSDSGSKIFVSYRRSDCAGHAGRLYDQLCERFGERQVFMDIDAIRPGEDFTKALTEAVKSSSVFLAIIGKRWLRDVDGTSSRLHEPDDFVRFEISAALNAGILIIPVLMEKASMPHAEDLPADLAEFTRRNAIDISDLRFRYDVKRLIEVIESVMPRANSPGARIGPYKLISKLGRGAFGVVWLAEKQTALATTKVALKTPNEDDVDLDAVRSEAEVWVAASGHPNIHPIIDADIYDGRMVIVSEYAPDGSLNQWLEANGGKAPSIEAAIQMTDGILAGLEHLHSRNILHRDLKPDNILLQGSVPRLADFGIAKMLKDLKSRTETGGSPWYLAPEAFQGRRSAQTDIWAVGVLLYQLVAGRLPFPQDNAASVMHSVVNEHFAPLPRSIPAPLQEVVTKTLEKDCELRFASASEMRRALQAAARSVRSADEIETVVPTARAIVSSRGQSGKELDTSTAPANQISDLRTSQSISVHLVLSEIPKYLSNFIRLLSSPKAFLRHRHNNVDQPLLRAMTFWMISALVALVFLSALPPSGWSKLDYLSKQGLTGVIYLIGYVALIRVSWRLVGGRAAYLSLFIPFAYLQGVAYIFSSLTQLLSFGIAKLFAPSLVQALFVNRTSLNDPALDAYVAQATTDFHAGHRSPLLIYFIVQGLPVLAFLLSLVWLFIGWGAFRELNGLSKSRSFWAWMILILLEGLIVLPLYLLIAVAVIAD